MRNRHCFIIFAAIHLLFCTSIYSQWTGNTSEQPLVIPKATEPYDLFPLNAPFAVGDGYGGAIVVGFAYSSGRYFLVIQKIDTEGYIKWTESGKALLVTSKNPEDQTAFPILHPDGQGGAYMYSRFQEWGGQHITFDGELLWDEEKVKSGICIRFGGIIDGFNSDMIIAGTPNAADTLLAQKMSSAGEQLWGEKGIRWSHPDIQYRVFPKVTSDGAGGVLFFWQQFLQHIDSDAHIIYEDPKLVIKNPNLPYAIQNVLYNKLYGAVVCIQDHSNQGAIYIQKIYSNGEQPWGYDGIRITDTSSGSVDPNLIFDNSGNILIVFERLSPNSGIFAQKVDSDGNIVTSIFSDNFDNIPNQFHIGVYPNPFYSKTKIFFSIPENFIGKVMIMSIYNLMGRKVKSIRKEVAQEKNIIFEWDGTDQNRMKVGSGLYLIQLNIGRICLVNKILHIR